jgi:hypothetical protein
VFTWSYTKIPGLDTNIIVYKVPLNKGSIHVKQKLQRTCPNMVLKVKAKIERQRDSGFLEVARYLQWVFNLVVFSKKGDKIKVCVDYMNLNKASLKDDFHLPHNVLIDNVMRSSIYSFMVGFSWYNHVYVGNYYILHHCQGLFGLNCHQYSIHNILQTLIQGLWHSINGVYPRPS